MLSCCPTNSQKASPIWSIEDGLFCDLVGICAPDSLGPPF